MGAAAATPVTSSWLSVTDDFSHGLVNGLGSFSFGAGAPTDGPRQGQSDDYRGRGLATMNVRPNS